MILAPKDLVVPWAHSAQAIVQFIWDCFLPWKSVIAHVLRSTGPTPAPNIYVINVALNAG